MMLQKTRLFAARLFVLLMLISPVSCGEKAETAVPKLERQLQNKETSVRNQAALKLASYGAAAQPAVPALTRLLKDPNGGVRSSAAYALRAIGTPEAEKALESYVK